MKKTDKQGWLIIAVVGCVFALLGSLAVYANINQKKYDPETFCPSEGGYPVVRILVDKTDPWDAQGSARLAKIIRSIKADLAVSERLSIAVLDQSGSEVPSPVFDMCNPGRGDQANPLYKSPRIINEKFEALFEQPLEAMLTDLLKPGTAPRSPLIEAIRNFSIAGSSDRLIIVSDLMQNSEPHSFYRGSQGVSVRVDAQTIDGLKSRYGSITVYFIDRGALSRGQKEQVVAFWKQLLGQMTASLVFERL